MNWQPHIFSILAVSAGAWFWGHFEVADFSGCKEGNG